MKKNQIFVLVMVILLFTVMLFTITACKNNDIIKGYSAEVFDSYIEIYYDDELVQKEEYPADKLGDFDYDYAKEHIEFVDVNFDGHEDICLAVNSQNDVISYMCWIYDNNSGVFVYSSDLSKLNTISLDEKEHQVISVTNKNGKDIYVCYEWVDGKLTKVKSVKSDSDKDLVDIIEAIEDNPIGVNVDNSTKTRSEITTTTENETTVPAKNQSTTRKNSGSDNTTKSENKPKEKKETNTTKSSTTTKVSNSTTKVENKDNTHINTTENQAAGHTGVELNTGSVEDGWF